MKKAIVKIEGVSPYSQSKYHLTEKKNKESHVDYENRTWRERLHYDKRRDNEIYIPPMQFVNAVKNAAKFLSLQIPGKGKSTYTKHFEAGIISTSSVYLGISRDEVEGETVFVPSNGVRGDGTRVLKTFPLINSGWQGTIEFMILDDTITADIFEQVLAAAGSLIGVGRFRPRNWGYYGMFEIKDFKWIED
jgi:hypothetical protein